MKHLLTAALIALTAQWAAAEVLSPARALSRATSSVPQGAPRRIAARAATSAPALTLTDGAEPAVYLFTPVGGGLIAVSAESEAEAMLGYSDSYAGELPPSLQMMLDAYALEIAALREGRVATVVTPTQADDYPPIAPLCKTRWDQGAPYNADMPEFGGRRCVTGCVATAMAQVLYSYKYPARCSGGTFAYAWENNSNSILSLNFDEVELKWSSMKTQYSETQSAPAVATLMKAVGYAAQMNYSPSASGAQSRLMAEGLVRNFGYDATLCYEQRDWYPLAVWQKKVYDALTEGHPLYYDGTTPDYSSGHAFVVDGYSSDGFFHLNWGWGGMSDGYYRLSALSPDMQGTGGASSGFEVAQGAIFGLRPESTTSHADAPLHFFASGSLHAAVESARLAGSVTFEFKGGVYNGGPISVAPVNPAVKLTAANGAVTYIHSSRKTDALEIYAGYSSFAVTFPSSLANGNYIISPAVYNSSTKKYFDVNFTIGDGSTITAEVSNGTIYFNEPTFAKVDATDVKAGPGLYPGTYFNFSATLTNNSAESFYGSVLVYLIGTGEEDEEYYSAGAVAVDMEPGEQIPVSSLMELPDNIPTGQYYLFMADHNGLIVSEPQEVTVATRPAQGTPTASALRCTNSDKSNLTFKMSIGSKDGLFADHIYLLIADYELTRYLTYATGPIAVVNAGGHQNVTITLDFRDGIAGTSYYAFPAYYDGEYISPIPGARELLFTPTAAGIEAVEAQPSDAPVEYFDLSGRRVSKPTHGIYIRRQGDKSVKISL